MYKIKSLFITLVLGIMMLFVAVCSAGSLDGNRDSNEIENSTIKIGGNLELSGNVASFGHEALRGAGLAVKEINHSGGVLGRQIEFVVMDNASQATESANAALALISQQKVVAIIGAVASSNTLGYIPVAEESRIPIISPTATNPKVTVSGGEVRKYVFRSSFVDPHQGRIMGNFAMDSLGAKRTAVIVDYSSDYSKGVAMIFKDTVLAKGGEMVAEETYLLRDQDFSRQLERVRDANPDVIFIPGYYQEVGPIIRQAREMGIMVPILGGDGWDSPKLVEYAGAEALNNTYFANHYSSQDPSAMVKKFNEAYKKEYYTEPEAISALSYDTVMILVAAIKKANSTEPEKIRDALETIQIEGVTGQISFDAFHNPVKPGVVIAMVNGKQTFYQRINP